MLQPRDLRIGEAETLRAHAVLGRRPRAVTTSHRRRRADAVRRPRGASSTCCATASTPRRPATGRWRSSSARRASASRACWRSFAPSWRDLPHRLGRGPLRLLRRDDRLSAAHRRSPALRGASTIRTTRPARAPRSTRAWARSGTISPGRCRSCATSSASMPTTPRSPRWTRPAGAARRSAPCKAITLRVAERVPLVLVVEDLHWIDPASEEYLAFIADVVPDDARAAGLLLPPGLPASARRSQLPRARRPCSRSRGGDGRHHRCAARHDRHSARGRRAHRGQGGGQSLLRRGGDPLAPRGRNAAARRRSGGAGARPGRDRGAGQHPGRAGGSSRSPGRRRPARHPGGVGDRPRVRAAAARAHHGGGGEACARTSTSCARSS